MDNDNLGGNTTYTESISRGAKEKAINILQEAGKFEVLKKHWSDLDGIEDAQTVHDLFKAYEQVEGTLNKDDLKGVLRELGCRHLLYDIEELRWAVNPGPNAPRKPAVRKDGMAPAQKQLKGKETVTKPGRVSGSSASLRGAQLALVRGHCAVTSDLSSSDDSGDQRPVARALWGPSRTKVKRKEKSKKADDRRYPMPESSDSNPSDKDSDSDDVNRIQIQEKMLSTELEQAEGWAPHSDDGEVVGIRAAEARTTTDYPAAGDAVDAAPMITVCNDRSSTISNSLDSHLSGRDSHCPDDTQSVAVDHHEAQGEEPATSAASRSQLGQAEVWPSLPISINGGEAASIKAAGRRDIARCVAAGDGVNPSPVATQPSDHSQEEPNNSNSSPGDRDSLDDDVQRLDADQLHRLPVQEEEPATSELSYLEQAEGGAPVATSSDSGGTVSISATGGRATTSVVAAGNTISARGRATSSDVAAYNTVDLAPVVTGHGPSENMDYSPCLQATIENLTRENRELEKTVLCISQLLQEKRTECDELHNLLRQQCRAIAISQRHSRN